MSSAAQTSKGSRGGPPTLTVTPWFGLLVWINRGICAASLAVMVWASTRTGEQGAASILSRLYDTCETVFKMTAGAFIGLMGGRAAAPDRIGR